MALQYLIIVKNLSAKTVPFYAFQKQAIYSGAGDAPVILASSLGAGSLAPYTGSGSQLDFAFDSQNYASAVSNASLSAEAAFRLAGPPPAELDAVSKTFAAQPIGLAAAAPAPQVANFSTLTVTPLGLSSPTYQSSVPAGSFGIEVPPFQNEGSLQLYCGCASINQDGSVVLSSYVAPLPNSNLYCAPSPCFYVKVGSFPAGQAIAYETSQAALCDFTAGASTINVNYNADGSYTVTSTA